MTLAGSSAPGPNDLWSGPAPSAAAPVRLGPAAAGRCRRRVHLDADPGAQRSLRSTADDGLQLRLSDGTVHRDEVLAAFLTALGVPGQQAPWNPSAGDRPAVVVGASLRSRTRYGAPDLLIRDGTGYQPVLIRSHRTTDPGAGALLSGFDRPLEVRSDQTRKPRSHAADALALAHHYRLLEDLGLAGSRAAGGVIGRGAPGAGASGGDSGSILWHHLDTAGASVLADYDVRFADRLLVATAAAAGAPALAFPSRIGECRRCSWWPVCSAELVSADDISLVAAGVDVDVLQKAGIRTVTDLAGSDRELVTALPLTGSPSATARVRARAWLAGHPLVRKQERVHVRRADLELDVDMESFLEDGAYLWGTYLTGPGVATLSLAPGYRGFVSWRPLPDRDEGRAFAEFWQYLSGLRSAAAEHGLTFAAYCYSRSAEERWLRSTPLRYPDVPGMPAPAEIAEFCASPEWVDIYQEIRDQFVVPGSMKLKALAPVAGFSWRDAEPGGENSMAWYRAAVADGDADDPAEPVDPGMARRILQYNEDDVLATLALRQWMTDRAVEVPTVEELDAD